MTSLRLKVVSVAAGLVLGLVMLEVGVRVLLPRFSPDQDIAFHFDATRDIYTGPANQVMRQRKNTGDYDVEVRFNRHGLRDDKDLSSAGEGDWIVVGDSFSFGWGVAQSNRFSNLIETDLGHSIYNVAIPGDVDHYGKLLDYAEREGADTSRVILGLCVENDILDYDRKHRSPAEVIKTPMLVGLKRRLGRRFATYRALTEVAHSMPWARDLAVSAGAMQPANVAGHEPLDDHAIQSTVARLSTLAASRRLIVLMIPSRQVFHSPYRTEGREQHAKIVESLRNAGVRVVDPLAEFDRAKNPLQNFYFAYDGHWNSKGHRVASNLVVEEITRTRFDLMSQD